LKWHLPLGLLYDIYTLSSLESDTDTPAPLPFKLTLHFSPSVTSPPGSPRPTSTNASLNLISPTPPVLHDSFINAVKEADFLRSGTAKPIMLLSASDSKALWSSVQAHELATYSRIYTSLLPEPGQFRNIPVRIYLPSGPDANTAGIKVLQAHIPPTIGDTPRGGSGRGGAPLPQTLGTALHTLLPNLFPSRRTPVLARPVLHGTVVPMSSHLEDLARCAAYADGWLGVVVVMNS
jgi:autophagy-related protein 5